MLSVNEIYVSLRARLPLWNKKVSNQKGLKEKMREKGGKMARKLDNDNNSVSKI